jgi:hypothetical protein
MIKLLVDGVFFQLNSTGIARVWATILTTIASSDEIKVYFLDRGNALIFQELRIFLLLNMQKCNALQTQ